MSVPNAAALPPAAPADAWREALEWQVVLWSGEVTAEERQAFERWRAAHPAHQQAWQRVQRQGRQLHVAPDRVARAVLRPPRPAPAPARRSVLRGLGLLAAAGIVAGAVAEKRPWQLAMAEHRTARGEKRDLTLPDGSRLTLNTASAVDLRFGADARRVLLRSGEIFVATARHTAHQTSRQTAHQESREDRPFIVETEEGSVRALGTRFTVRRFDEKDPAQVLVQVFEGAVEISPRGGAPIQLDAGRQARFGHAVAEASQAADTLAAAWSQGLLVAERMRLGDFLAELGRYRSGVLRCDPAVAGLVVSGVYPLDDSDRVLNSLAQALPVRVHMSTRYWVTVTAR
ncbi:FecR domain-containing protein [Aquabacterium sp.]|uniref:FecR domain-containing protein n=1 Tax=Aquabacterium sp. TaxID=1872578 RepID=UPI002C711114|nr:FecR domain-containing protein [Aquabacterium sp.]HSW04723.1 FecR domain-containing protein [Aquabacterium sp.]